MIAEDEMQGGRRGYFRSVWHRVESGISGKLLALQKLSPGLAEGYGAKMLAWMGGARSKLKAQRKGKGKGRVHAGATLCCA